MRLCVKKKEDYMTGKGKYDPFLTDIREMYEHNISIKEISEKYNMNSGTLIGLLKRIGVFRKKRNDWTEDELNILQTCYATSSREELLGLLPSRKWRSIVSKAHSLGISRESYYWNDDDISILKENYNKISVQEIEKLLDYKFSSGAIKTKAGKLGLTVSQLWTSEEEQILIENYPKMAPWQVAELIPLKSLEAIKHRAEYYKIRSGVNNTYTKEESDYVSQNYLKMSDEEIAQEIGRSRASVKEHRHRLKLYRPTKALETSIAEYLRKHNYFWRMESAASCGNKCVITGRTENLQIHHKYSMNKILDTVLREFSIEKYQTCD